MLKKDILVDKFVGFGEGTYKKLVELRPEIIHEIPRLRECGNDVTAMKIGNSILIMDFPHEGEFVIEVSYGEYATLHDALRYTIYKKDSIIKCKYFNKYTAFANIKTGEMFVYNNSDLSKIPDDIYMLFSDLPFGMIKQKLKDLGVVPYIEKKADINNNNNNILAQFIDFSNEFMEKSTNKNNDISKIVDSYIGYGSGIFDILSKQYPDEVFDVEILEDNMCRLFGTNRSHLEIVIEKSDDSVVIYTPDFEFVFSNNYCKVSCSSGIVSPIIVTKDSVYYYNNQTFDIITGDLLLENTCCNGLNDLDVEKLKSWGVFPDDEIKFNPEDNKFITVIDFTYKKLRRENGILKNDFVNSVFKNK